MCSGCGQEYSTGWDAPGHIPWENTLEHTTRKWLPEGSLFSSESFSRALCQARNRRKCIGSGSSQRTDNIKLVDFNSEMLEMMHELHSLRSYFAEPLQDDLDSSYKPSVPALVVSTSYVTFPLTSLESSQNISQISTSAIATRRGTKPLPPLTIQKKEILSTIPSTNASRSHDPDKFDIHPAVLTRFENPKKSALRVEEMISNLRFQCSSMLPTPSPPVDDTSWNSRSPLPLLQYNEAEMPNHPNTVTKHTSAKSSPEPGRNKTPSSVPATRRGLSESRLKGKLNQPKFFYKKRTSTDLSSSQRLPTRKPVTAQTGVSTPPRITPQKSPRSAMAKSNNRSLKPYKMVRFALPKSEVAKDLVGSAQKHSLLPQPLSTTHNSNDSDSKIIILPDDMTKTVPLCPSLRTNYIPVHKDNRGVPISTGSSPLKTLKMRTRSVSIHPFRKIALTRESVELKAPTTESSTTLGRRSHSLGAHSLSRIIKGPMLALKENKRATVSLDSTVFKTSYTDEKRRMSTDTVQGNPKKNRMPIHIKSLLTRFK